MMECLSLALFSPFAPRVSLSLEILFTVSEHLGQRQEEEKKRLVHTGLTDFPARHTK